jgi:hypothetical protein
MPLLVPKVAAVYLLKALLRQLDPVTFRIHLYTNDLLPNEETSLGSFTELTALGYAPLSTVPADWTMSTVADGGGKAEYPALQWDLLEACTVYGYFVTDASDLNLAWCERFTAAPVTLPIVGGILEVSPFLQLF